MQYAIFDTAWGHFGFVAQDQRLIASFLPRARRGIIAAIRASWPEAVEAPDPLPSFRKTVVDYFNSRRVHFSVEIDVSRMPRFQRSVLEACRGIPYGRTASYGDLARAAGRPNAARAAGGAMARNPLPLVVPCHRVLRSDGSIGGFSSTRGVAEKLNLLQLENVSIGLPADGSTVDVKTGPTYDGFGSASQKRRAAIAVECP